MAAPGQGNVMNMPDWNLYVDYNDALTEPAPFQALAALNPMKNGVGGYLRQGTLTVETQDFSMSNITAIRKVVGNFLAPGSSVQAVLATKGLNQDGIDFALMMILAQGSLKMSNVGSAKNGMIFVNGALPPALANGNLKITFPPQMLVAPGAQPLQLDFKLAALPALIMGKQPVGASVTNATIFNRATPAVCLMHHCLNGSMWTAAQMLMVMYNGDKRACRLAIAAFRVQVGGNKGPLSDQNAGKQRFMNQLSESYGAMATDPGFAAWNGVFLNAIHDWVAFDLSWDPNQNLHTGNLPRVSRDLEPLIKAQGPQANWPGAIWVSACMLAEMLNQPVNLSGTPATAADKRHFAGSSQIFADIKTAVGEDEGF